MKEHLLEIESFNLMGISAVTVSKKIQYVTGLWVTRGLLAYEMELLPPRKAHSYWVELALIPLVGDVFFFEGLYQLMVNFVS